MNMRPGGAPLRVLLLTPVLDDWEPLAVVATGIKDLLPRGTELEILAVDDGSHRGPDTAVRAALARAGTTSILRLARTVGHQRAIATGLRVAAARTDIDHVIVMDSDGEDSPSGFVALLREADRSPDTIVVARRGRRQEARAFRVGYRLYRVIFRAMTGLRLDFGNFCLLPPEAARRLAAEETIWSHFAATVARSRYPKREITVDRETRVVGASHMNLYALTTHGLGAMAVFADRVFLRVTAISGAIALGATIALGAVVIARLATDAAIPGWATTAAGVALIVALQTFAMTVLMTFVMLQQRVGVLPLVAKAAEADVLGTEDL